MSSSLAKDIDGEYAVYSVGADTCENYLKARQRGGVFHEPYLEWLKGYLSAFNSLVQNTYNIMGAHGFERVCDLARRSLP